MIKRYLCLILFFCCALLSYGQKYQGSVSIGATIVGFNANVSNGVLFNKDYIGIGAEAGVTTLIVNAREWGALYLDYQHYFSISDRVSIFLQASPGMCYSDYSEIGNGNSSEKKVLFFAKAGTGLAWSYRRCGMAIGYQNTFFCQSKWNSWIPTLQLSLFW